MQSFQKKLGLIWFATLALSSTSLADSVTSLRRDLAQAQAPARPGEMKMSQFRSGAGLTCELARKHLDASPSAESSGILNGAGSGASRAL